MIGKTPTRPSSSQRYPADDSALDDLLRELNIRPPGRPTYELVSEWAAKHVWRVNVRGKPWAFVRYLLGSAEMYPERWRHLRLSKDLHEAKVGPAVLGMSEASDALQGRAVLVEGALLPLTRDQLEARAAEAIHIITRLHKYIPLHNELSRSLTDADRAGISATTDLLAETHDRWFNAVVERWLECGLPEINDLREVVGDLLNELEQLEPHTPKMEVAVPSHNDPNHGNFMVNHGGAIRMIDFEELALNTPVADLGIFLTWYVDADQHRDLLLNYPFGNADTILARAQLWVPLRYLNIAAHWAARMTRARDEDAWEFAALSVEEWLISASEMVYGGLVPPSVEDTLNHIKGSLLDRWPLELPE